MANNSNSQSPTKLQATSYRNHISNHTGTHISSRGILRQDLEGRIEYDVNWVMDKVLGVNLVSSSIINACIDHRGFAELKRATKEEDMYEPLMNIFYDIADVPAEPGTQRCAHRQIIMTKEKTLDDEGQWLPAVQPDLSVVDVSPTTNGHVSSEDVRRRQAVSFWEIKYNEDEDPKPKNNPTKTKVLTSQMADYASGVFGARPFQIFVVAFVMYSQHFRAAVITRSNIYFSPGYDISVQPGKDMLLRVARRLTWDLTDRQLGLDPTVSLTPGHSFYSPTYPSFTVKMEIGFIPRDQPQLQYITRGPPIFASLSFLSRGTSVWMCNDRTLLKVSWRSPGRPDEASIYSRIGSHPGIAKLNSGGDVMVWTTKDQSRVVQPFDVNYILRFISGLPNIWASFNLTPHRVSLGTFGKPLSQYTDTLELLEGLLAIVGAFRHFESKGILHRDVSPGNLYLWDRGIGPNERPPVGFAGFIADLEYASVPPPSTVSVPVPPPPPVIKDQHGAVIIPTPSNQPLHEVANTQHSVFVVQTGPSKSRQGPSMTGTAQFIALELLESFNERKHIPRGFHHDLESFLLSVLYSIYQRKLSDNPDPALRDEYDQIFGNIGYSAICLGRSKLSVLTGRKLVLEKAIADDPALATLVHRCRALIYQQNITPYDPELDPSYDNFDASSGSAASQSATGTRSLIKLDFLEKMLKHFIANIIATSL